MKDDQGCVLVTSAPVSLVHQAPPGHCCPVGSDVLMWSVRGSGKVEGVFVSLSPLQQLECPQRRQSYGLSLVTPPPQMFQG